MIQVNKLHSVEYRNDYFILRSHGETKEGKPCIKSKKTYPDIGSMIMQCGFDMSYEYTDAAMKSKAEYMKRWNDSALKSIEKRKQDKIKGEDNL